MKPGPRDWVYSIALALAVTLTVYIDPGRRISTAGIDPALRELDRTLLLAARLHEVAADEVAADEVADAEGNAYRSRLPAFFLHK